MTARVGFAVFGMGTMGMEHVQNIMRSSRASLKWLVRNKLDDARKFAATFDLSARCTTPDKMATVLDDPSVDAVVVVSPSATHEPLITASLKAGKAVFSEKPLTVDIVTTKACFDLAEKQKQPLLCAFHRRFDPSFLNVYRKIQSGEIGPLRILKTTSRDVTPPPISYIKTSGGILADSTIHDLDICHWMANSRPQTVFAAGRTFDPEIQQCGDKDQIVIMVTYENGAVSVIDNGRLSPHGYDNRLEVLCEKALLTVDNRATQLMTSHTGDTTSCPRIDRHYLTRYTDAYRTEIEHFIDVVKGLLNPVCLPVCESQERLGPSSDTDA